MYDPDSARSILTGTPLNDTSAMLHNSAVTTTVPGWIGIADADAADAAACPVRLLGSVASGQTSLTVASTYYIQEDGTLATTFKTDREVGRAVSATELLITQPSVS